MIKKTLILIAFCISSIAYSQNSDEILAEGKLLFRLEKASWNGTDDFLARFPEKRNLIGGYLSYESDKHEIMTIFFGRENNDSLLVRYQFDSIPNAPIEIDTVDLKITSLEKNLIEIRQDAIQRISNNSENFFTFYENTALNPIPLITDKKKRVFILTGTQVSNVVIIGNDYLLEYDKKNRLKNKTQIHKSLLQFPYKSDNPENKMESTYHSHVVSDYINSTDICTLLLYKDYVEWTKHFVMSNKYVSIFDMEKENLAIMKRKAWEKIYNQQIEKK
ncbi:hypothetical protein [Xiashengella succiniciproducens]|uniref:Uncharacterized protein n=1 Tax=Xiashengella succiniciproducens TaxID=2949635 RepID=A0A9J6ZSX1_9BACT|nr:hypothetical protein [Alkaliflexus sp. Ai-910]URW80930.1 hypothetical protein M9189_06140 [Alkaliflexus sp. Ai-910]